MLNNRVKWVLGLSLILVVMLACSKKEETAPATETGKAAPQAGMEHAAEQAHKEMGGAHEAMKEEHQAMEEMHGEMKEEHQAMEETHAQVLEEHKAMTGEQGQSMSEADMALGEKVYNQSCVACHGQGIAGAPKVGDKEAWAAHIAEGVDHLVQTALTGEGAMPPRGGNPALSDEEVKAAVIYMVEQSR